MPSSVSIRHHDVVVIGGGASGIAASSSSAANGADTLLIDAGPVVGGELLSGIPIDGCLNTRGELYPTALLAVTPVSTDRREVALNTTRVANVDATDTAALSATMPQLVDQVWNCQGFLRKRVPGFEEAAFAGLAPRIGIRETRRIVGEHTLTGEDVLNAVKRDDGIAKGGHHVDIHGDGTDQVRRPIRDGGSYDIPFGCLVPKDTKNLLVAGRCLSADREAHSTARVMGSCMGMGQAAGTAAAMAREMNDYDDIRAIDGGALRARLKQQGAVLDGIL